MRYWSIFFATIESNLVVHLAIPALGQFLVLFEGLAALYQEFSRLGGNNGVWWHGLKYQGHAAYFTALAYGDRPEDGCSHADGHVVFDGGMTLLATTRAGPPPAGRAKCYLVIQHYVIADLCRLSNHHTGTMVNKETFANLCSGMNLDAAGYETRKLRD